MSAEVELLCPPFSPPLRWAKDFPFTYDQRNRVSAWLSTAKATEVLRTLEKHGWVTALPAGSVVKGSARKLAFRIHKTEGGE